MTATRYELTLKTEFGQIEINVSGSEAELAAYRFDAGNPLENVRACKQTIQLAEGLCQKLVLTIVDNFPARDMEHWAGSKLCSVRIVRAIVAARVGVDEARVLQRVAGRDGFAEHPGVGVG